MKKYGAPVLFDLSEGSGTVVGEGTSQGTVAPNGMTFEQWKEDLCWGIFGSVEDDGANEDADYNKDGYVNEADWQYYLDNELWKG